MKTDDLKRMFEMADRTMPINDEMKRQTRKKMSHELERRKIPVEKRENILLNLFLYIDKSFLYVYGIFICLEILLIFFFHNIKIGQTEILSFCMMGSGIISITAMVLLDKVFFYKMAELGASCYFCTKQSIAAYMIAVESINLMILLLTSLYVSSLWKIAVLQFTIYILTPFLLSNVVSFGILMIETGRKSSFSLLVMGIFMSIIYLILPMIPNIFSVSFMWMWGIVCVFMSMIFVLEIKKYLNKVEKGELLCMN